MTEQMTEQSGQAAGQTGEQEAQQQLAIQRIFVKDISFETPNSPAVFQQKEWQPKMHIDIHTDSNKLENDVYESILRLTVTVKSNDETAFVVEVNQAGLFSITGLNEQQLAHCLGSYCPTILYPYAREAITDLVSRGSFPQLVLAPVNFDALYAKHLEEQKKSAANGKASDDAAE